MAAGDTFKVWFEEIVALVRSNWHRDMTCEELVNLTTGANQLMLHIRRARGISPATFFCLRCQKTERAKDPSITVRAVIIRARCLGLASFEESDALEKKWRAFQHRGNLDGTGQPRKGVEGKDGYLRLVGQTTEGSSLSASP